MGYVGGLAGSGEKKTEETTQSIAEGGQEKAAGISKSTTDGADKLRIAAEESVKSPGDKK